MPAIERIPISRLSAEERDEIESILRAGNDPRYLSDLADAAAWWILVLVMGTAGAAALLMEGGLHEPIFLGFLPLYGLVAVLGIMAWVAVTWIRHHGRRGYLATSFATIRIKGPRLVLMRHARAADWRREGHGRPGRRFTILKLIGDDGRSWSLTVHGGWADEALRRIGEAKRTPGPAS